MQDRDPTRETDLGAAWVRAMRAGAFAEAWAISGQVLRERDPATRDDPALPYHLRWVWDGRAFDGRDVLVRCYHGLGDTIQYARHLPALARRAASLTVEAQPELCLLLADMGCIDRLHPFDVANPLPPSECDLEITELPFALREAPDAGPVPYLRARDAASLPPGTVGLCCTTGDWDVERRMPAAALAPIAALGPAVALMPGVTDLPVLNPQGCSLDIAETAALVEACDLVVTVDTMIAHLAGAMGRPVWLMLKAEPDWRWPTSGRRSIRYPTARLYHQARAGDWTSVLSAVTRDLVRWRADRSLS